jgi:hypothetical protein
MALNKEASRRAEGYGYYSSYGSDANDVLGFIEGDLELRLTDYRQNYGTEFKVTIIVEEV